MKKTIKILTIVIMILLVGSIGTSVRKWTKDEVQKLMDEFNEKGCMPSLPPPQRQIELMPEPKKIEKTGEWRVNYCDQCGGYATCPADKWQKLSGKLQRSTSSVYRIVIEKRWPEYIPGGKTTCLLTLYSNDKKGDSRVCNMGRGNTQTPVGEFNTKNRPGRDYRYITGYSPELPCDETKCTIHTNSEEASQNLYGKRFKMDIMTGSASVSNVATGGHLIKGIIEKIKFRDNIPISVVGVFFNGKEMYYYTGTELYYCSEVSKKM